MRFPTSPLYTDRAIKLPGRVNGAAVCLKDLRRCGIKQFIKDWDAKFKKNDIPWEDFEPSEVMVSLFQQYAPKGAKVFEIGCGLGINAMQLTSMGYQVTATDISPEAIQKTIELSKQHEMHFSAYTFDVKTDENPEEKFDIVFDKGCFHSFVSDKGKIHFAKKVFELLKPNGLWIDISGSADNADDPLKVEKFGYPRISLAKLAIVLEPYFEVIEIKQCVYGKMPATAFKAWACVMKKRA